MENKNQIWSITYDDSKHDNSDIFGQEISIEVRGLYEGQANKEYLIDLDDVRLQGIMKEYGLELLPGSHKPFSTKDVYGAKAQLVPSMTEVQIMWFNLQYNFAFKKTTSFLDYDVLFSDTGKAEQKDIKDSKPVATIQKGTPRGVPVKPIPQNKIPPPAVATSAAPKPPPRLSIKGSLKPGAKK